MYTSFTPPTIDSYRTVPDLKSSSTLRPMAYFNNYVSQSKEVFTLLSRHLHDALTWCDKTCPLSSTDKHRACEGDIVSAVFIILDLNEKSGWTERNAKREFYTHAHTIVGSEKSLWHALDILSERRWLRPSVFVSRLSMKLYAAWLQ